MTVDALRQNPTTKLRIQIMSLPTRGMTLILVHILTLVKQQIALDQVYVV
jgi:hypothetical protein